MSTIADFNRRLENLKRAPFQNSVARTLGDEMVRQIGFGFATRSDPYGDSWQARKRQYPWPILEKTGDLRGSFMITDVRPLFVRVESHSRYGIFHQLGTANIDSRKMVPTAARGLGMWGPRLGYLTSQEMKAVLNG